jgi:hypothetical protein
MSEQENICSTSEDELTRYNISRPETQILKESLARELDTANNMVSMRDRITSLESQLASALAVIAKKDELISQCIENNLHLADGDNCTLKLVKEALAIKPGDVTLVEYAEMYNFGGANAGINYKNDLRKGDIVDGTKLYAIQKKEG